MGKVHLAVCFPLYGHEQVRDMQDVVLRLEQISKSFGGVPVLDTVSFSIFRGEVLALSGENGAGKSTLMKIVAGLYPPDRGRVFLNDKAYETFDLKYARNLGVSLIYQELSIAPNISVMENIFMGSEKSRWGVLHKKQMLAMADELLQSLNANFSARELARNLSVAQQQLVEIARTISHDSNLIIMDEPTASLSNKEVENLFDLIHRLQQQGITIIYISHKMDEIQQIANRVAVLRDGRYIGETGVEDVEQIIYMMVGRSLSSFYDEEDADSTAPAEKPVFDLELKNLSDTRGLVQHIDCKLSSGTITGLFGLVGAGRSELARLIFGADPKECGEIFLNGKPLDIHSPDGAIHCGVGMVPEDRKLQGLFIDMSSLENLIENNQVDHAYWKSVINQQKNRELAKKSIGDLRIRTTLEKKPRELSGGNQQKILFARWLNIRPNVLILDEPTRGVDVGAKQEIYKMIRHIAAQNTLVLFISSELPEILHLSERILVMREGQIVGDIQDRAQFTQEHIMHLCTHN